jgi:ankyrin repeat protein
VPAVSLAFVGIYTSAIPFTILPLLVILTLVVMIVSLIMFDSDIEQPRLENTRASFINRLIYVRKGINFFFMATLATYTAIGIHFSPLSMDIKQYGAILLLSFVLIFKFNASLKLMKDESLSYFIFKRDLWNMGIKMGVFVFPVIMAKILGVSTINISPYGDHAVFNMIRENNVKELQLALKEKDYSTLVGKKGFKPIHAAIREGHIKVLELLLKHGHDIALTNKIIDKKYQGFKPSHLAVLSKNVEMFKKVKELKEFEIDERTDKTLKTPLIVSAENCSEEVGDYLIGLGADVNAQDHKGKTPLMHSIEHGCDSLTSLLIASGPDLLLEDRKGKVAYEYMSSRDSMKYLLKKHMPQEYFEKLQEESKQADRAIASEAKD